MARAFDLPAQLAALWKVKIRDKVLRGTPSVGAGAFDG